MRFTLLLILVLIQSGCSSRTPNEDLPGMETSLGRIVSKQLVDREDFQNSNDQSKTSVFASFSSGGGLSIGIGFLLSAFSSEDAPENLVQYEVKLPDGKMLRLFSEQNEFEVSDCVEITMHEDVDQHPPVMKLNKDAC
jgi:hypothetical protein